MARLTKAVFDDYAPNALRMGRRPRDPNIVTKEAPVDGESVVPGFPPHPPLPPGD